jgi:hypothetical protein
MHEEVRATAPGEESHLLYLSANVYSSPFRPESCSDAVFSAFGMAACQIANTNQEIPPHEVYPIGASFRGGAIDRDRRPPYEETPCVH